MTDIRERLADLISTTTDPGILRDCLDEIERLDGQLALARRQARCDHTPVATTTGAGSGQTSVCQRCGLAWRYHPARREYL
jgi:hypothetical protein